MSDYMNEIPANIQRHIKEITKTSGLPDDEESFAKIAEIWLTKKRAIEEKMGEMEMEEIDILEKDDAMAAIAMTYSGSIITLGPIINNVRKVEYISIGLRKDVPDSLTRDDAVLKDNVILDKEIVFEKGPVKNTSPIYKIITFKEELSPEEQEKKLKKTSTMLTNDFVEVNRTIMI